MPDGLLLRKIWQMYNGKSFGKGQFQKQDNYKQGKEWEEAQSNYIFVYQDLESVWKKGQPVKKHFNSEVLTWLRLCNCLSAEEDKK